MKHTTQSCKHHNFTFHYRDMLHCNGYNERLKYMEGEAVKELLSAGYLSRHDFAYKTIAWSDDQDNCFIDILTF